MCRFLAYWGDESVKIKSWLIDAENSLLKQSSCDMSNRPNPDGWGVAFRKDDNIVVIKNTQPAYEDHQFIPETQKIESDLLFAHIRRRSQGEVKMENTHPFVSSNWIFMHNGNIPEIDHIKARLNQNMPEGIKIETSGATDSEFLFKYFVRWFEQLNSCDVFCALNIIYNIIGRLVSLTSPAELEKLALNFLLTNGKYVIGYRRNRTLFYSQTGNGILLASEPVTKELHWNEVPENHFIICMTPQSVQLASYDIELKKQEMVTT